MTALALVVLAAVAWVLRIAVGLGDDGLGGQDPWAYLDATRAIGAWLHGTAGPPTGYFWPLGYPMLGAALSAFGVDEALALRSISQALGAATAPVVAAAVVAWRPDAAAPRLALLGRIDGLIAGVVVACGAAATLAGAAVMADATMLFWLAIAAWLLGLAHDKRGVAAWALAALAIGAAIVTRQAAVCVVPAAAWALLRAWRQRTLTLPAALAVVAIGALLPLLQLAVDPTRPGALDHAWLQLWRPWNAVRSSFDTVDGHMDSAWPQGLFAAFAWLHPGYLAPPGALLVGLGLRAAWRDGHRDAVRVLGAWSLTGWAMLAGMPHQNFRFGLALLVPSAIGFGLGAAAALRPDISAAPGGSWSMARPVRLLVLLGVALTLAWTMAWTPRMAARHLDARAARRALVAEVAAEVRRRSADLAADGERPRAPLVVALELTADLQRRAELDVVEIATLGDDDLQRLREAAARRPLFLVVDDATMRRQWAGTAIASRFARLEAAFDSGPPSDVRGYRVARLEPRLVPRTMPGPSAPGPARPEPSP